jgi:hypothetical protein
MQKKKFPYGWGPNTFKTAEIVGGTLKKVYDNPADF